MTVLEKSIKQLNRVSISFSLGLGLVLGVAVSYTHLTLPTNREV